MMDKPVEDVVIETVETRGLIEENWSTVRSELQAFNLMEPFVELEPRSMSLIHISEIRSGYVSNIHDTFFRLGEGLVQVNDVDEYSKKASLS